MFVAITTPSGKIGRAVVNHCLRAGAHLAMLARRPEKVSTFVKCGAHVFKGSQEDPDYVIEATRGVDALFWLTPPSYDAENLREAQNRFAHAAAEAIRVNRIPRVVNLSSVGAHLGEGTGPIDGIHDVEQQLNLVAENIMHLRPGFFFENYLWQVDSLAREGEIHLPISGTRRYPLVATADIAQVAADCLLETTWQGHCVRELHGPEDLSFDEAATAISAGLGRLVTHVRISEDTAREGMLQKGMTPNAVEMLLEMYGAVESGWLQPAMPRSEETTTPTRLVDFTEDVLRPLVLHPVSH